jgi:hypothetical protein
MVEEEELALPLVSMPRIIALRDKLTSKLTKFEGHMADSATFQSVVDELTKSMPAGITRETIQNSVLSLRNVELTADVLLMMPPQNSIRRTS